MSTETDLAAAVLDNFIASCPRDYWVDLVDIHETDDEDRPVRVTVHEIEDEMDRTTVEHTIDLDDVIGAIKKIVIGEGGLNRELTESITRQWNEKEYDGDLWTDDAIVQIACLGKVVYG